MQDRLYALEQAQSYEIGGGRDWTGMSCVVPSVDRLTVEYYYLLPFADSLVPIFFSCYSQIKLSHGCIDTTSDIVELAQELN